MLDGQEGHLACTLCCAACHGNGREQACLCGDRRLAGLRLETADCDPCSCSWRIAVSVERWLCQAARCSCIARKDAVLLRRIRNGRCPWTLAAASCCGTAAAAGLVTAVSARATLCAGTALPYA